MKISRQLILAAILCNTSVYGRISGQARRRDHLLVPHEHEEVTEESTEKTPCITGFQLVSSAIGLVQNLIQGASVSMADIGSNPVNIVVETVADVDWVRCNVNDVVEADIEEKPFVLQLQFMDWLSVIGNTATCECEGFHITADGTSISMGSSTVEFDVISNFIQNILDCNDPCDNNDVGEDQVVIVPSDVPSDVPSVVPSDMPSTAPSDVPSLTPSFTPSAGPSSVPTASPSDVPTAVPSDLPSTTPSVAPSVVPTAMPTDAPSATLTTVPSSIPSDSPSSFPSDVPSALPSDVPSNTPSAVPSASPSSAPSDVPSVMPSDAPSITPSTVPSSLPSDVPSEMPSDQPSSSPSITPSAVPTPIPCFESISLVSSNGTVLQDLLSDEVINLSDLNTTSLNIVIESDAAVDSIEFQWEQDGQIISTAEKVGETDVALGSMMGGQSSSVPVSYLTTPGVKAVVIDVYEAGSVLLCRKILPFVVVQYSGSSAVQSKICENWVVQQQQQSVQPALVEEVPDQPAFIHIAPLYLH